LAINHIKKKKDPNLDIINKVLNLNTPAMTKDFDLCSTIIENSVTLDLPLPGTKKVISFSKIAGVENLESLKKSGKFVPGCYRIWGLNKASDFCYIGQTRHLGLRVKYHAKGQNKNTFTFCNSLGNKGKVDLYILPKNLEHQSKLSKSEFLCVLEQYLIFKHRPLINKIFIARPGIIWDEKVIMKHREKVGKKIYIYIKSNKSENNLEFVYMSHSSSYASQILGYERSWIKNILYRNKGWYKNKIFFSLIPLNKLDVKGISYSIIPNLKDKDEIKTCISNLLRNTSKRKGKTVIITNMDTSIVTTCLSKKEAAKFLNADPASIYTRTKLFRGRYKIEILD